LGLDVARDLEVALATVYGLGLRWRRGGGSGVFPLLQ
jgi:hypothetical protein